ncbi:MAG: cupin domain-containing protein [Methyloligellaceae bacterium]
MSPHPKFHTAAPAKAKPSARPKSNCQGSSRAFGLTDWAISCAARRLARNTIGAATATLLLATALPFLAEAPSAVAAEDSRAHVTSIFTEKLPNVPGKSLTAVVVTYAPAGKSPRHRHAGSVFVYVLSGAVRSENSATGPAKVYKAGKSFFEPAGSTHLISENASTTEPATLLAVFLADEGAQLTTYDE